MLIPDTARVRELFAAYAHRPDQRFITQDVCEPLVSQEAIRYINPVAGKASFNHFSDDPAGAIWPNILGTYCQL